MDCHVAGWLPFIAIEKLLWKYVLQSYHNSSKLLGWCRGGWADLCWVIVTDHLQHEISSSARPLQHNGLSSMRHANGIYRALVQCKLTVLQWQSTIHGYTHWIFQKWQIINKLCTHQCDQFALRPSYCEVSTWSVDRLRQHFEAFSWRRDNPNLMRSLFWQCNSHVHRSRARACFIHSKFIQTCSKKWKKL